MLYKVVFKLQYRKAHFLFVLHANPCIAGLQHLNLAFSCQVHYQGTFGTGKMPFKYSITLLMKILHHLLHFTMPHSCKHAMAWVVTSIDLISHSIVQKNQSFQYCNSVMYCLIFGFKSLHVHIKQNMPWVLAMLLNLNIWSMPIHLYMYTFLHIYYQDNRFFSTLTLV